MSTWKSRRKTTTIGRWAAGIGCVGIALSSVSQTFGHDEPPPLPPSGTAAPANPPSIAKALKADAGEDRVGTVGRRVALIGRGIGSADVGFRWIQVQGPPVAGKKEDGEIFTFVPNVPGTYRFALVVASGNVISEPDDATVTIGADGPIASSAAPMPSNRPRSVEDLSRAALAELQDGPTSAEALALAFDEIASRIPLYQTYTDVFQGTSTRLETLLPADPARRSTWNDRLFIPLTTRLIDDLRHEGLDLAQPSGRFVTLNPALRLKLAEHFRSMARGFRELSPTKDRDQDAETTQVETPLQLERISK